MKLEKLTLSEQVLVKILAKLNSIDPSSAAEFEDEVTEEVMYHALKKSETNS
jgi:hypothetical protein